MEIEIPSPGEQVFVIFGDTRFGASSHRKESRRRVKEAMIAGVAGEEPAFVLMNGDMVKTGGKDEDWAVWDHATQPWREAGLNIYPAIGNHEMAGDDERALRNYFQRFPFLDGHRYYSISTREALFLMLDSTSSLAPGSPQRRWLERMLEENANGRGFIVLIMHHPFFTRSKWEYFPPRRGHRVKDEHAEVAQYLESKAQSMRARLIAFTGHVHNYERYERNGVTYITTAGGGARPHHIRRQPGDAYQNPGTAYHYCRLRMRPGRLSLEMVRLTFDGNQTPVWQVEDSFALKTEVSAAAAR